MSVRKIHNVYYVTKDMARTNAFYEHVLGLPVKFKDGERWTQYSLGGANFSISGINEAPDQADGATVVFEVRDIEAWKQKIVDNGGTILSFRDMNSHGKGLAFADPDGNVVQLIEKLRPHDEQSVGIDLFRSVMRNLASSVVLISIEAGARIRGMTATAFTSVSADPPLVLFCIHCNSDTHDILGIGSRVGVSFLNDDQVHISQHFASKEKKSNSDLPAFFMKSPSGAPVVVAACAVLDTTIVAKHWGGDHSIFVARINWAKSNDAGSPLLYYNGHYATLKKS